MREKETATIGCAVVLCGLVSPWCKLATTILVNLYNNKKKMGRGEEGGGEKGECRCRACCEWCWCWYRWPSACFVIACAPVGDRLGAKGSPANFNIITSLPHARRLMMIEKQLRFRPHYITRGHIVAWVNGGRKRLEGR